MLQLGRPLTTNECSHVMPPSAPVTVTLSEYPPPVPALTLTHAPLVGPAKLAPEVLAVKTHEYVLLPEIFVVTQYWLVVPAHTGVGPSISQLSTASDFSARSWLPPWPSRSISRMW